MTCLINPQTEYSEHSNSFEALTKVVLPTVWQGGDLQRAPHGCCVLLCPALCNIQARDLRDRHGDGVAGNHADFIAGANFSFAQNCEIETGSLALEEALDHAVRLETD